MMCLKQDTKIFSYTTLQKYFLTRLSLSCALQMWDGRHGTLECSLETHAADVHAMVATENAIFASGVDSKLVKLVRHPDKVGVPVAVFLLGSLFFSPLNAARTHWLGSYAHIPLSGS